MCAPAVMKCKNPIKAAQMHVRRRHEGREAGDESEGLENDGSYPALPGPLQVHDELAVGAP